MDSFIFQALVGLMVCFCGFFIGKKTGETEDRTTFILSILVVVFYFVLQGTLQVVF